MRKIYLILLLVAVWSLQSQTIVNAYAKVTTVTNNSVLAVSNVNQANHTFVVGERVIIMQMQDNVIGTNTANNSSFGLLSSIANAGNFEIRTILSRSPASGAPTSITLSSALGNTYNTGTNSSVQLITFRYLGNTFTTTADITGLTWDGNIGGVIGIEVNAMLTLNHRIIADGIGFSGGSRSDDADETCTSGSYRVNDATKAYKGEGIFKRAVTNQLNGRARIINGGGGGSENNTGGGGGGNYTAGGNGGLGYQCTTGNTGCGLGGVALNSYISSSRVFMGGGGGGGQMNNGNGSNGGNGGGIVLLKTSTLVTTSTCGTGDRISANGQDAANSGNDGSGGGGAGGSIILQVSNYAVTANCPLINSASGGAGGNVNDPASHGGGGGGGQGVIFYSIPQPTANITTSVTNGAAGSDNSSGGTSSTGGGGTNGSGVVTAGSGPLPIELVNFYVQKETDKVRLLWTTASEKDNDYFTVEKSEDGVNFIVLGNVAGAGNSRTYKNYNYTDTRPYSGISYYRLKQTDISREFAYSPVVSVSFDEKISFSIYPNPAETDQPISVTMDKSYAGKSIEFKLYDLNGKELISKTIDTGNKEENNINLYDLGIQKGIYVIKINNGYSTDFKKLIVK